MHRGNEMKVLHISENDMLGAGGAAIRMNHAVKKKGIRSDMHVLRREQDREGAGGVLGEKRLETKE
jgi:shikimate 5-dehydrogenase